MLMDTGAIKLEFCRKGNFSGSFRGDAPVDLFEPVTLFDTGQVKVLKTGSKITSAVSGNIFIKCYFYHGLFSRVRHLFRLSRAESSFHSALAILNTGVPTPEPLGYLREKRGLLPCRELLFTKALPAETLFMNAFIRQTPEEAIEKLAECMAVLHENGIEHGDMSLRNFYLASSGQAGVIDLDGCRIFPKALSFSTRELEMARVISSAAKLTDLFSLSEFRERFLEAYKKRCGIDLTTPSLDARINYLYHRRRA